MIDVQRISELHRATVERWHRQSIDNPYEGFLELVCEQHRRNYEIWHEEDIARRTDVGDAVIARVKRNIDRLNQQRNDHIEKLDLELIDRLGSLGVRPRPDARLNSETPGSVIDRLSILSLRVYHLDEQLQSPDTDKPLGDQLREKLEVCHVQHQDLSRSLTELLADVFAGRKLLKVYRQFKLYNDPRTNPYLRKASKKPAA
jgi:hypothetical protein